MEGGDTNWQGLLESESSTVRLAARLAPHLRAGDLLILSGGLGVGKTFFTRALCHELGLGEEERVTSPTFNLVNEYDTQPPVVHADLYRLSDEDEVFDLGLETARSQGHLLVVEWGAPFVEVLGGDALFLDFDLHPRRARLRPGGPRSKELLASFAQNWGGPD